VEWGQGGGRYQSRDTSSLLFFLDETPHLEKATACSSERSTTRRTFTLGNSSLISFLSTLSSSFIARSSQRSHDSDVLLVPGHAATAVDAAGANARRLLLLLLLVLLLHRLQLLLFMLEVSLMLSFSLFGCGGSRVHGRQVLLLLLLLLLLLASLKLLVNITARLLLRPVSLGRCDVMVGVQLLLLLLLLSPQHLTSLHFFLLLLLLLVEKPAALGHRRLKSRIAGCCRALT